MDLTPFIEAFHAESQEGLDAMEASLLKLETGDPDAIHDIFRAAHSIKGGAGTFGLNAVSEFTHRVETLLDLMRAEHYPNDADTVALLLDATDCIRSLLCAAREDTEPDMDRVNEIQARLDAILERPSQGPGEHNNEPLTTEPATKSGTGTTTWRIEFRPGADMLAGGNDPLGLFRELSDAGDLIPEADFSNLPDFEQLDPERCYLSWSITLKTAEIDREHITDTFEWVIDECQLSVEAETAQASDESEPVPTPPEASENTADSVAVADDRQNTETVSQPARSGESSRSAESSSIRVNTGKIDQMINMVGELVITQSMLSQVGGELDENADSKRIERLREGLSQLERNTRELQESIMAIRMVPISFAFNRLPRLVHDVCAKLGKHTELSISGEQTEIDKTLIEKIGDPLVHIVRNAIDHGIESPDERTRAGKSETGQLHLEALHKGGNVVIEIRDDGRGLDKDRILEKGRERGLVAPDAKLLESQIFELLFAPGFSTADEVSDLSGRGVGMDVVRRNIMELGGDTEIESTYGTGTTVRIILPLTLAILDGQAIRVADELYVIPLVSILESIQLGDAAIRSPAGALELVYWREEYLPLIRLQRILNAPPGTAVESRGLVVIVEGGGHRAGIVVDELLSQQQVVIKSLEENFQRVEGFSGATILGDGSVSMIIDVAGLIKLASRAAPTEPATKKESMQCKTEMNPSPA